MAHKVRKFVEDTTPTTPDDTDRSTSVPLDIDQVNQKVNSVKKLLALFDLLGDHPYVSFPFATVWLVFTTPD